MKVLGFGAVVWDDIEPRASAGTAPLDSAAGGRNIGGAVFNLVMHAKKLGASAYMFTALGDDDLGRRTLEVMRSKGVTTDFIKTVREPTCLVSVTFDERGEPHYEVPNPASWDAITVTPGDLDIIDRIGFDYFCFGTIEQRNKVSRAALRKILGSCRFRRVYLDLTLRREYTTEILEYSLRAADIAKMNEVEAEVVKDAFALGARDRRDLMMKIAEKFDIDIVCITAGESGAHIGSREAYAYCPAYRVTVSDPVGAGDAFAAGLMVRLEAGDSLADACNFACKMGALICSKTSSLPDYDLAEIKAVREIHTD